MSEIVNRVANSGLVTIDLGNYYPQGERTVIDLKDQLWQGLAVREKDFRAWVKENDWSVYTDKHVAVHCSEDAIIPAWAYMLVAAELKYIARSIWFGTPDQLEADLWKVELSQIDAEDYVDARIVIKGCGDHETPPVVYILLTNKLQSVAKSIMYGEPCSTVPVWKRPRK